MTALEMYREHRASCLNCSFYDCNTARRLLSIAEAEASQPKSAMDLFFPRPTRTVVVEVERPRPVVVIRPSRPMTDTEVGVAAGLLGGALVGGILGAILSDSPSKKSKKGK
jgi:hypothetical protein